MLDVRRANGVPVTDQFSEIIGDLSFDPSLDEAELADRFAAQVAVLQPLIDQLITLGLRVHFREAVRNAAMAAAERSGRGRLVTRVMLVAPEPGPLLEPLLRLVDLADAEGSGFPQVRVGVPAGPAITRGGDWFGSPVNLASRLSAIARGGSILATEDVRDATDWEFRWSDAGMHCIRGVHGPVAVFRARPAGYVPDAA